MSSSSSGRTRSGKAFKPRVVRGYKAFPFDYRCRKLNKPGEFYDFKTSATGTVDDTHHRHPGPPVTGGNGFDVHLHPHNLFLFHRDPMQVYAEVEVTGETDTTLLDQGYATTTAIHILRPVSRDDMKALCQPQCPTPATGCFFCRLCLYEIKRE